MLRRFLPSLGITLGTELNALLIQCLESAGSMTSSTANDTSEFNALPRM